MEVSVLASGSSGNCTFIEEKDTKILIDAGISFRRIAKSLETIGKDIKELNAVFITHEHDDHVRALEQIEKHDIRVFMTKGTHASLPFMTKATMLNYDATVEMQDIRLVPKKISHDAEMPTGFEISGGGKTLGHFTDLGRVDKHINESIHNSDGLVLESNHDIDMLLNGNYPYHLKQRIMGDKGHLSNIDSGLAVRDHGTEKLKHVFLSHLSKNNNTEELADRTFSELTRQNRHIRIKGIMTSQDSPTDLIKI